jgi:hypothetical protein
MKLARLSFALAFLGLPAQAKYGGGMGEPNDPYLIHTAEHLYDVGAAPEDWDKHFKLMADIDLSGFNHDQFNIIGIDHYNHFRGSFDGNSHTISNLTCRSAGTDYTGLFGCIDGYPHRVVVRDLGLIDPNIDAGSGDYVGSLVGKLFDGTLTGCYVHGGNVSGHSKVGGLVGWNYAAERTSMGITLHGLINNCHAMTNVSGSSLCAGGLVGDNWGTISDSYATGSVLGSRRVGGLVGVNTGEVLNCYSSSNVEGTEEVGGLVGSGDANGVTDSLWDYEASGQITSAGGQGRAPLEMRQRSTFTSWDFTNIWDIAENQTYPFLRAHPVGDLHYDGRVDLLDLAVLGEHWLQGVK